MPGTCYSSSQRLVVSCSVYIFGSVTEQFFRFMQPGTPHYVITLEDALAIGGHFFNLPTIEYTLRAMLIEHFFGTSVTNIAYPQAAIALMKLVDHLVDVYDSSCHKRQVRMEVKNIKVSSVACLCVLVRHLDQLYPEEPDAGMVGFGIDYWKDQQTFQEDFEHGCQLVEELVCVYASEEFLAQVKEFESSLMNVATELASLRKETKLKVKLNSLIRMIEKAMQDKEKESRT